MSVFTLHIPTWHQLILHNLPSINWNSQISWTSQVNGNLSSIGIGLVTGSVELYIYSLPKKSHETVFIGIKLKCFDSDWSREIKGHGVEAGEDQCWLASDEAGDGTTESAACSSRYCIVISADLSALATLPAVIQAPPGSRYSCKPSKEMVK